MGTHHPLPTMTSADATAPADALVIAPAEATAAVAAAEAPADALVMAPAEATAAVAPAVETRLCKKCGVELPLSRFNQGARRFCCRKHTLERQSASRKPSTPAERVYRLLWTAAYKVSQQSST